MTFKQIMLAVKSGNKVTKIKKKFNNNLIE